MSTRLVCAFLILVCAFTACGEKDEPVEAGPLVTETTPDAGEPVAPPAVGDGEGGVGLVEIGRFDQPLFVTQPEGEDALYVVEQCGLVRVVEDGEVLPDPFLDVSADLTCGGERGLLSIAFAPDYAESGLVYSFHTDAAGDTRVLEFERSAGDPMTVDPRSERVLLELEDPFSNHNGGLLLFDAEGRLHIGIGDGGSAEDPLRNGQDLGVLFGKILRIDPRPSGDGPYGIPAGNPFARTEGAAPEVFAYGLRNPWRFSFDRETGDLWIGDVGQDELEEIDSVTAEEAAGSNFGWSAFEGSSRFNTDQEAEGHIPPVLEYPTSEESCSVTGGYVVRDPGLPSLFGRYLYADFCAGELRSFSAKVGKPASDDRALGVEVPLVSSFGEDSTGHIYVTSLEGPVYRLVDD